MRQESPEEVADFILGVSSITVEEIQNRDWHTVYRDLSEATGFHACGFFNKTQTEHKNCENKQVHEVLFRFVILLVVQIVPHESDREFS